MTLTNKPAFTFVNNTALTPEKLNRNLLAAVEQIEGSAQFRYRKSTFEVKMIGSSTSTTTTLPFITGTPYTIERIVVTGTWPIGTPPTISWSQPSVSGSEVVNNLSEGLGTTLQYDVFLPSVLVEGTDVIGIGQAGFRIDLNGADVSDIQVLITIRTDRNPGESSSVDAVSLFRDGNLPDATDFNTQIAVINSFVDNWSAATKPHGINIVQFNNVGASTHSTALQFRIPGNRGTEVIRVVGWVESDTGTMDLNLGFGTPTLNQTVNLNPLFPAFFSTGTLSTTDNSRDPTSSTDDYVVSVSFSTAVSTQVCMLVITRNV